MISMVTERTGPKNTIGNAQMGKHNIIGTNMIAMAVFKTGIRKRSISLLSLLLVPFLVFAQDAGDTLPIGLQFSGTIKVNTNGIATVPAFSLGKPAVIGILSFNKKRFGFDQYIAFSAEGEPWFLESYFNFKLVDSPKFDFNTSAMWGIGYSHPEVMLDGTLQTIMKAERYVFLIFSSTYKLSEKVSVSGATYHGYGFPELSIRWANFISLVGNIARLKMGKSMYASLFPQLLYINLDYQNDGFFVAGTFGVGHKKWPLFLSTQLSQVFAGNLSPSPGFKWSIGLSYHF